MYMEGLKSSHRPYLHDGIVMLRNVLVMFRNRILTINALHRKVFTADYDAQRWLAGCGSPSMPGNAEP